MAEASRIIIRFPQNETSTGLSPTEEVTSALEHVGYEPMAATVFAFALVREAVVARMLTFLKVSDEKRVNLVWKNGSLPENEVQLTETAAGKIDAALDRARRGLTIRNTVARMSTRRERARQLPFTRPSLLWTRLYNRDKYEREMQQLQAQITRDIDAFPFIETATISQIDATRSVINDAGVIHYFMSLERYLFAELIALGVDATQFSTDITRISSDYYQFDPRREKLL